jgi:glycosyltransferase involved in cell wall biosynthesis
MSHRPQLSVVLLNYNHGQFISEAFTALAEALDRNDELIVIDDASRDDSVATLERLRPLFPSFRLVVHDRNQGVVAGMNEGLGLASHNYIYFAASDDRVSEALFEKSMPLLGRYPEAGVSTARMRLIDKDGGDLGLLKTAVVSPEPRYLPPAEVAQAIYREDNWLVGCSTIYRRDALISCGGFRLELGSFCDGFASRLLALKYGACFIPDALSFWRRMSEGYSQSETADKARVAHNAQTAMALFRGPYADVFLPAYADRWLRRWMFGARSYAIYGWRMRASRWMERAGAGWARPLLPLMKAAVTAVWAALTLLLFLRLRPFDVLPTLRRRIRYMRNVTPEK